MGARGIANNSPQTAQVRVGTIIKRLKAGADFDAVLAGDRRGSRDGNAYAVDGLTGGLVAETHAPDRLAVQEPASTEVS